MAQNRNMAGFLKADMYFKQSSICIKALVTMSFKHCTAFTEFSSYFKSWSRSKQIRVQKGVPAIEWCALEETKQCCEKWNTNFLYRVIIFMMLSYKFMTGNIIEWRLNKKSGTSSLLTYLPQIWRGQNIRDFGISLISSR